jgi:hypothetical protein
MTNPTDAEIIATLKDVGKLFEVNQLTKVFKCYRNDKQGGVQMVTVELYDAGPDSDPQLRYHCVAKTDTGKSASGNPGPSIAVVLATVHWWDLDK